MAAAKPVKKPCPTCKGRGVTPETAPELKGPTKKEPGFKTLKQGSGCPACLGEAFCEELWARIH